MATRSRDLKNSAISASVLFFVRVFICPNLPQCGFYPGGALDNRVRLEVQPWRAFEAQLGPDRRLDAAGGALQALVCGHLILAGEHAIVHRSVGEVGAHPY